MEQYINFDVFFDINKKRINVEANEYTKTGKNFPTKRLISSKSFRIILWWHTPAMIASKINRTVFNTMMDYKRNRRLWHGLDTMCSGLSNVRYSISDGKTSDFLKSYKKD